MKKILAILLVLVMVFSFAACGGTTDENAAPDRLEAIKAAGVMTVATEPYFAPYEFIDPNAPEGEQIVGFDVELAKYIGEQLGVEVEFVPLDFTAVLAGVTDGKYDIAISAISYSPSREEAMALSKGYYFSDTGYGFICRAEDVDKYNSIEDLADAVVVTQSGSVQEAIYNQYVDGKCKELKLTSQMTDGYLMVAANKADVCIVSCTSAQLYADANGNELAVPEFRFEVDPEMNSVRVATCLEGTDSLIEFINGCIDDLLAEDKINEWDAQYAAYAKELGIE